MDAPAAPAPVKPEPPAKAEPQPAVNGSAAAATSLPVEAAIERVEGFLRRLAVEHDKEGFFQERVSTALRGCEDYYDRIKHPMWFSRIREKLRAREYRTLHQLQSDVELVCSNATTFNQKSSRVYKNAQSMLKGCRKQLLIERGMLAEAVWALHPGGPDAARAEEAAEARALQAAQPPKKPPAKPSKPPKKTPAAGSSGSGLLRMVSSPQLLTPLPSIAPGSDFSLFLGGPNDNEDLLVNAHAAEDAAYSSFSDTDGEEAGPSLLARMGEAAERQVIGNTGEPPGSGTHPTISSGGGTAAAWKHQRRGVEWRLRWLEHRLREIGLQQRRYAARLGRLSGAGGGAEANGRQGPELAASRLGQTRSPDEAAAAAVDTELPAPGHPALPSAKGAAEPLLSPQPSRARAGGASDPKTHHWRGPSMRGPGGEPLLEHPFFAVHAGLSRSKQVVRDADDGAAPSDDGDFPARAYAALELLERQMNGLRRQLCQPGTGPGLPRKGFLGSASARGAVKGPGLKVSQPLAGAKHREAKPSKRRRTADGGGSGDFILPSLGGSQSIARVRASKITTPSFAELGPEDARNRAAISRRLEERDARGAAATETAAPPPPPSSSEEDTDDDAFARMHGAMQDLERAMYAGTGWTGGAQKKKKNKDSSADLKDALKPDAAVVPPFAPSSPPGITASGAPSLGALVTSAAVGAQLSSPPGDAGATVFVPGAAPMDVDRTAEADALGLGRGRTQAAAARGRGRARARGRPPNAAPRVAARGLAATMRPTRPAGPGRGHKTPRSLATDMRGGPPFVASALPPNVAAEQPALSGGAADSELTDPQGGVDVPVALAPEKAADQPAPVSSVADPAPSESLQASHPIPSELSPQS